MALLAPSPAVLTDDVLQACASRAAGYDRDNRFCREDLKQLCDIGYLTLAVPIGLGGLGADLAGVCQEQRRLAYGSPATAFCINMHLSWTGMAADLWRAGDRSPQWLLEEAGAGEVFAAGHAEAGNDLSVLMAVTTATPEQGGYRLSGHKTFGSLSSGWTRLGVHATDTTGSGPPKMVYAFMPRDTHGYRIVETLGTLGMRAARLSDTIIDDAFVPERYVARVVPAGIAGADAFVLGIIVWAETTLASIYCGLAQRAFDLAVQSAGTTTSAALGGRTIAHNPMTLWTVAEMAIELDAMIAHLERVTVDWSTGVDHRGLWPSKVVACKYRAMEGAKRVVDLAGETTGRSGMFMGEELERLYRDVRGGGFHPADRAFVHELVGKTALVERGREAAGSAGPMVIRPGSSSAESDRLDS